MIRQMNKKTILLAGAALFLTVSLSIGSAMAYFTTYATSSGSVPLKMGFTKTVPREEVDSDGKHITIENIGDYDCFIRVKVFADIDVTYDGGSDWSEGTDGYWYYNSVLATKTTAPELLVKYEFPVVDETKPEDIVKEFNIIVIQECTPVVYDDAGNPSPDWTHVVKTDE